MSQALIDELRKPEYQGLSDQAAADAISAKTITRKDLTDTVAKELVECKSDRDELRKLYHQMRGQISQMKGHNASTS